MTEYIDYDLYHFGIPGMKWGIRRYQYSDGSLTPEGKKRYAKSDSKRPVHEDYARAHSGKNVKYMSDNELKNVNNRLNMEKQYRQLSLSEVNQASKAYKTALAIAGGVAVATTTGINIYNNIDKIRGFAKK